MAGLTVAQETITLSGYDLPTAKTLLATWNGTAAPTASFTDRAPLGPVADAQRRHGDFARRGFQE